MILPLLLTLLLQGADTPAETPFPETTFLETIRIIHNPPAIMFEGRPYDIESFVDFPRDSVISVHLFLKTDNMSSFWEIPLTRKYDMYSYRYFDKNLPADSIHYFFLVEVENALFATPLDSVGHIAPVVRELINPVEYYKAKK